jgi:hypothetical protein
VSHLRRKRYKILLVVPSATTLPEGLHSQVSGLLDWDADIIGSRSSAVSKEHAGVTSAGIFSLFFSLLHEP